MSYQTERERQGKSERERESNKGREREIKEENT